MVHSCTGEQSRGRLSVRLGLTLPAATRSLASLGKAASSTAQSHRTQKTKQPQGLLTRSSMLQALQSSPESSSPASSQTQSTHSPEPRDPSNPELHP